MRFYDAHCHLHMAGGAAVLDELRAAGVAGAAVNGTRPEDWDAVEALADARDWLVPSYGLHPWFADRDDDWLAELKDRLTRIPQAAVGEIGLDKAKESLVPMALQEAVFLQQLDLACEFDRPATIHCVRCYGRLAELLESADRLPGRGIVLRSFAGSPEMVGRFAALAPIVFSFSGMVLHEKNRRQRDALRAVPESRLLLETDAPNMPLPDALVRCRSRGIANHPANIVPLYEGVAAVRGIETAELAERAERTFVGVFR